VVVFWQPICERAALTVLESVGKTFAREVTHYRPSPSDKSKEVTKVVVPHFRIKDVTRKPYVNPDGQSIYVHQVDCELDNGDCFSVDVDDDQLTAEGIRRAIIKHFERYR